MVWQKSDCRPNSLTRFHPKYGGRAQAFAAARKQQAKSWELRAAMSMARLHWRSKAAALSVGAPFCCDELA